MKSYNLLILMLYGFLDLSSKDFMFSPLPMQGCMFLYAFIKSVELY